MKTRFILLTLSLFVCRMAALAVPSIQIDSVTPDGPWFPGDSLKLSVTVSYADAPWPARVDVVLVEESESETDTVTPLGARTSVSFDVRDATKTLGNINYQVPYRSCFLRQTSARPQCFQTTPTFAASLITLKKLSVVARLLDEDDSEVVTASREVEIKNPEITSLGVNSQPLNTERKQRVVVEGAKFEAAETNFVPISVYYVKADDPSIYWSISGWANPAFNRPCMPPSGGGETNAGACNFKIIDNTTLEFTQRNIFSPVTAGELQPDSIFDKFIGTYDVYVLWAQAAPSADFNFRNPDAVLLNAFTVTAPIKEDSLQIKKITLSANTNPPTAKTEEFTPGGESSHSFAPNASVVATVEFEYNLTRRLGARIWFLVRRPGQVETIGFPQGKFFWNTLGNAVPSDGSDPRSGRFSLNFPIPADGGLEFSLVMTDMFAPFATFEQDAFVKSVPLVLSADTLGLSNLKPAPEDIRSGANIQISADVEYLLKTRNQADLALRVFDENGVLQATSVFPNPDPDAPDKFHRVSKATAAATLPLITQPFIVPATKKLRIKAVFIDILQPGVFHESPITEYELTVPKLRVAPKEGQQEETFAGDLVDLDISVLKDDGTVNEDFSGEVHLRFDTELGTKGVGTFVTGRGTSPTVTVRIEMGHASESVALRTPERRLSPGTPITPETVLEGKAAIVVELAGAPDVKAAHTVEVRSPLDLEIDRIELQQAVSQPMASEPPMIAGRPMLARLFVTSNTNRFTDFSHVEGVTAKLTVRGADGEEIPGSPFALTTSSVATSATKQPYRLIADRSKLTDVEFAQGEDSLNVILPALDAGEITLEATLDKNFREVKTEDAAKNTATLGPIAVAQSRELNVLYSKAKLQSGRITSEFPGNAGIMQSIKFLQQVYPVGPNVRFIEQPDEVLSQDPIQNRGRFSRTWFWLNRTSESNVEAWIYFVDNTYLPAIVEPTFLGWSMASWSLGIVNSDRGNLSTLPHELGHILGLGDTYHLPGAQPNAINNPRKTAADGNLGSGNPVEHGSYSWFHQKFAVTDPLTQRSSYQDFMGNDNLSWTDARTWNYLQGKFLDREARAPRDDVEQTYVIAEGMVEKAGGGSFLDCLTLRGVNLAVPSTGGSHAVVILDAAGAVLDRFDFDPEFRASHATVDLDNAFFSHALPLADNARTIQLRAGADVLDTRAISANAPVAGFVTDLADKTLGGEIELTWAGSDADGQALRYSLYYSPDGKLQLPLAEGINATTLQWDTDQSPSGPAPRLTLVATDGVLATLAESAIFSLPNRAPRVSIFTPLAGATVAPGAEVILSGGLYDPETGLSTEPMLAWTSDKQGPLGVGPEIAAILAEGPHRLTATGVDEAGLSGSASIDVTVGNAGPPDLTLSLSLEGNQIRLSWPASAAGFVPQSSDNLVAWGTVTSPVIQEGDSNTVRQPIAGAATFFRLAKP